MTIIIKKEMSTRAHSESGMPPPYSVRFPFTENPLDGCTGTRLSFVGSFPLLLLVLLVPFGTAPRTCEGNEEGESGEHRLETVPHVKVANTGLKCGLASLYLQLSVSD